MIERPRVVLSHPGCAPFVQNDARALHEAGLLSSYVTTFAYQPDSRLGRSLRAGLRFFYSDPARQLGRRAVTEVPQERVRTHPAPEIIRMAAAAVASPVVADYVWDATEKWFDRLVAQNDLDDAEAVFGYEYAALETFRAQRARGGKCLYEMPIPHYATAGAILAEEFRRFPEADTLVEQQVRRLAARRNVRKQQELDLADLVICHSSFARDSLLRSGVNEARVRLVPMGAPPITLRPRADTGRPFVFLSAGTQSVRKGVHYLLDAWRRLAPGADTELWLVGHMALPTMLLENLPGKVVIRPSVPRRELDAIYARAGVLVFPSLCEGFGMVITEAMAQGVPVITTTHTAGADLIDSGINGWLVPTRDPGALADAMRWCLDHRDTAHDVGREAQRTAARWQWSDYRAALGALVWDFLSGSCPQPPGAGVTAAKGQPASKNGPRSLVA